MGTLRKSVKMGIVKEKSTEEKGNDWIQEFVTDIYVGKIAIIDFAVSLKVLVGKYGCSDEQYRTLASELFYSLKS